MNNINNFENNFLDANYTKIPNEVLNDKNITLKAKGLLCYLISKKNDWNFSAKNISSQSKEKETSVSSTLKELEANKYLERVRIKNNDGQFIGIKYILNNPHAISGKPISGKPNDGKSKIGKTKIGKPTNISNTIDSNTISSNTILSNNNNYDCQNSTNFDLFNQEDIDNFSNTNTHTNTSSIPKQQLHNTQRKKIAPKKESIKKSDNIKDLAYTLIKDYWMIDFKQNDYYFHPKDGKAIKSIIEQIKFSLTRLEQPSEPNDVLNIFKHICLSLNGMNDFFKTADLTIINSKYNSLIENIKNSINARQQQQANSQSLTDWLNDDF